MTVDETWVHYYEPENKAQSRQWVGPGSPRPKTQPSAGKVMATVFWDTKGVIILDFLPKKLMTVLCKLVRPAENCHLWKMPRYFAATGQRVSPHLQSCNGCCRVKRVWINTTSCLFAWPTPSYFFLFPNLKKDIRWLHFWSDEEVVTAVRSGSMERTLTFSVLGWWHLNTGGLSALH